VCERLVPSDHFYRHLEKTLDLSFVRDWVKDCYAANGRPSVDPVVFLLESRRDELAALLRNLEIQEEAEIERRRSSVPGAV
jgi:hypothetical protein